MFDAAQAPSIRRRSAFRKTAESAACESRSRLPSLPSTERGTILLILVPVCLYGARRVVTSFER